MDKPEITEVVNTHMTLRAMGLGTVADSSLSIREDAQDEPVCSRDAPTSDKKKARFRIRKPLWVLIEIVTASRGSLETANLQALLCARQDSNLRPAD